MARAKILVVEDDDSIRRMFVICLRKAGYEVFEASHARQLVEVVRRERPAVIVLDFALPGVEGGAACEAVRFAPDVAHTRIIIVTAHSSFETVRKAHDAGADLFVTKPIGPRALIKVVERAVRLPARVPVEPRPNDADDAADCEEPTRVGLPRLSIRQR